MKKLKDMTKKELNRFIKATRSNQILLESGGAEWKRLQRQIDKAKRLIRKKAKDVGQRS